MRAHARGRLSAMPRVQRDGAIRSPDGLLGPVPSGTDPPAGDSAREARGWEIRTLLEAALKKLQEGGP